MRHLSTKSLPQVTTRILNIGALINPKPRRLIPRGGARRRRSQRMREVKSVRGMLKAGGTLPASLGLLSVRRV